MRHVPVGGLMTVCRYRVRSFRRDIRSVTTTELLPERNFISYTGIALWELHFRAAATVQFRVTGVTRRIFVRHVAEQRGGEIYRSRVWCIHETIHGVGEIAARPGSPVERTKTTTTPS